jgi:hypothetical protein
LQDIQNSPNNSTLVFEYNENYIELYNYCKQNSISYGVIVNSIKEFIFIMNTNAKYAFCYDLNLAKKLQKIADNYLSEIKVIVIVKNYDTIEDIVLAEIDGIIKGI